MFFIKRVLEELLCLIKWWKLLWEETDRCYIENPPVGAMNLSIKKEREENGGDFESAGMILLNKTVASMIRKEKLIANIGSGTGIFERYASEIQGRKIIASEFDRECVEWCSKNRPAEGVVYCSKAIEELLQEYGKFDLSVCIDVIEHIENYGAFLKDFSMLAERALITTPNKSRNFSTMTANPPKYIYHVREWTPGEFYWVLRTFYRKVDLYGVYRNGKFQKISLLSNAPKIIAECVF